MAKIAGAGLLTLSLTLSLGVLPAHADTAATPTATPTAEPSPTPTAAPSPTSTAEATSTPQATPAPEPSPAAASGLQTGAGAYMGQGAAKQALGYSPQAAAPMSELVQESTKMRSFAPMSAPAGVLGLDVSGHQADAPAHSVSNVNWGQQWSLGARFVYAKATEGNNFIDRSRVSQWQGAAKAGITLHGAYHFALPGQSSAVAQADFFVANGGGWRPNASMLPPLLDIEYNPYSSLGNTCYNQSPGAMVAWIKAFSNRVLALTGRLPMIYTTTDWWQRCTGNSAVFGDQPLHIAAYASVLGALPKSWTFQSFWQYSSTGPFAGDSNTWNGTLANLQKFAATATVSIPRPSIQSPADLVAADGAGILWNYPANGVGGFGTRRQIGQGWSGMRSVNVIDWNADGILDLVAQRTTGALSVYKGLSGGGFASPLTLASSGWAGYQLTIGYWLNSSKYPQILARDTNGVLTLWSNPSGAGLGAPKQIGQGWGSLNLTMLDFDGDGRQDILAQDSSGAVRLYRSNGGGAFYGEPRKVIGTGWHAFTSITVLSDFSRPGAVGLLRRSTTGALSYQDVPGNGTFSAAQSIGSGWSPYLIAGAESVNIPQPPLKPAAPSALAGDGRATVTVARNPSGPVATSITIHNSRNGSTCTIAAASGSCSVGGLTNGMAYAFSATAKNAGGASSASPWSASVVPYAPTSRIDGQDRYETSAATSRATFAPGVAVAYIASALTFPDALSGAAAAGAAKGPVLLTASNGVPATVRAELTRLKPHKIVILGGTGVVTGKVATDLKAFSSTVTRISGTDRYATSAAVSKASNDAGVGVAYIASGLTFPDALSGAAAAGSLSGPVLLTASNGLPTAVRTELTRLKPKKIVILGGTGVVTSKVATELTKYAPSVTRISGADRYSTSAAISKASNSAGADVAYIASGLGFPDALAGAAAAGAVDAPVLLVTGVGIPPSIRAELTRLNPRRIVVLGGSGVVGNQLMTDLLAYTR
ncbi:cell wall-binding repeat-containing protein [Specibacter sp. RAF43]|uniref:cell wall-binding repeat-containing protein n=1 Tax=Specibacter sp. RAF43 TaxID=3233057 RepID=UPI003F9BD3A3